MKALSLASSISAGASAITKDEVLFILSLIIVVINAIIEYLKSRKDDDKES